MKLLAFFVFYLTLFLPPNEHQTFIEFETEDYHVLLKSKSSFLRFNKENQAFQFSQDEAPDANHLTMVFSIQNLHPDTLFFTTVKSSKGCCVISTPKTLAPNEVKDCKISLSTRYLRHVDFVSRSSFTCVLKDTEPLIWRWLYTPVQFKEKE